MTDGTAKVRLLHLGTGVLHAAGVAALFAGLAVYLCYRADRVVIRRIAQAVTEKAESPAERVLAINRWVHWQNGFVSSRRSFLFAGLGATPLQIVEGGGDCADKSRLVVALLREIGIGATPVMCFDPSTGKAVHTVVEAHLGGGSYMVVDPSFNLHFPAPEPNAYYGLLDLRRDPTILSRRLDTVISSRDFWLRVNGYRRDRSVYELASTYNWNKNAMTRLARGVLAAILSDRVYRIRRLHVLEEPKLAVAVAVTTAGAVMLVVSGVASRFWPRRRAEVAVAARAAKPLSSLSGRDDDGGVPAGVAGELS